MKKTFLCVAVAMMIAGCGFMKNSTGSNVQSNNAQSTTTTTATTATTTTTAQNTNAAVSAGQGAGNALLNLYNQYKADGNKYDYKNMQNVLNTVTLVANCEGLKDNYKNTTYLKEFGKGLVASSLGLVTQDNVEAVTNSLVDMVKNSETVQNATQTAQNTANTAAGYANTAAQYAGALSMLLGMFGGQ